MVAEYLIQSLEDNLDDLEETYTQLNRDYKRKYRECDLIQRNYERIKKEYQILQQSVKSKCELIERNGLTIANHLDPIKLNNETSSGQSSIQLYIKDHSFVNNHQTTSFIKNQSSDHLNIDSTGCNNQTITNSSKLNDKSTEIKQNGFYKQDQQNSVNSHLNHHHHNKQTSNNKFNGQFDDSCQTTNGFNDLNSSSELSNGYLNNSNKQTINGLNNSSLNSNHQSNHHSSSSLNKRYTDLSSCSSLSSTNDKTCSSSASLIFSEELYHHLTYIEGKTLNEKINFLLHDKINKLKKIKILKSSLDDEKIKSIKLESLSLINGKQSNGDLHRFSSKCKFRSFIFLFDRIPLIFFSFFSK